MSVLILNAQLVNEGKQYESDVLIEQGRIARVGGDLQSLAADEHIDAQGKWLLPGLIDDQVHFREPGLSHKADIASESRAAVAGGVTSFMEMPNTCPSTTTLDAWEAKNAVAAKCSLANYAFYFGATNDNLAAVKQVDPRRTCGIKIFMGSSTGNMLVDDRRTLEAIFREAPVLIATHCEDTPTILANEQRFRDQYGEDVPMHCHPQIRSEAACYTSSSMAVALARRFGARLHILHISTARELSLFDTIPLTEKRITAEACVHHLWFQAEDYAEKGTAIKCNPAIKSAHDRQMVRAAVIDGRIDVIATDHAPHTLSEKQQTYFKAPSGLPLVQHSLQMLLALHEQGVFSLPLIVQKSAHNVADLFGVEDRGYIREGYWADLVLVDPRQTQTVQRENIFYKCGWSPLEGHVFHSAIDTTFVNGEPVYRGGRFRSERPGMPLRFRGAR